MLPIDFSNPQANFWEEEIGGYWLEEDGSIEWMEEN